MGETSARRGGGDQPSDAVTTPAATELAALADQSATALRAAQDHPVAVLSEEDRARVWSAVDASTAGNTKAAYRSDWARFTRWAGEHGHPVVPAHPLVVAAYLTAAAAEQSPAGEWRYRASTLTRWASSINQFHTAAGLDPPGRAEVVRRALAGIRRLRAEPPRRRAPLLLDDVKTLLISLRPAYMAWPTAVAARRDAALLLLGFGTAARRSELVGLTVADVTVHTADGLHVRIARSKTDQDAEGAVRAVPYGRETLTCAACAVLRWRTLMDAADQDPDRPRPAAMAAARRLPGADRRHICTDQHPDPADPGRALFPAVHKTGVIYRAPMTGHAVNHMLARRAAAAGFTPAQVARLGGHSLRSGFVTQAFRAGADAHAILRQTGHRNPAMLEVYAREHAPLVNNAVTKLGL